MHAPMRSVIFGLALAVGMVGGAAWADPPGGFKHGKDHGREMHDRDGQRGGDFRFQDHDRVIVHDYFADVGRHGRCPPGLAKKGNGCMPPGQAKKWRMGAPLPRDVVYYPLPPTVIAQLTPPPVGYQYVRVASDILMIAAGTGMVAAAIEDLGR